jgi:nicotinamide-nucleotide amidase
VADAGEVASLDRAAAFVRSTLGDIVFTETAGASLAKVVLEMLRVRSATLSVAESCTGGLLGDTLTDVAGSSDVFVGGVIAYANAVKLEALGVASETLATYGAVSEQVVAAMAEGARRRLGSTYALAVSGVAGPNGGTPDKPVGTVWLALAGPSGVKTRQLSLSFDRRYNKVVSVAHALDLLRRELLV